MKEVIDIVPEEERQYGLNLSSLVDGIQPNEVVVKEEPKPKKKAGPGRKPSQPQNALIPISNTYTDIVTEDKASLEKKKNSFEKQVEKGYYPQVNLIAGVLAQTDRLYQTVEDQLQLFRDNKSFGGKTRNMAMAELQNTQVSLINTKLAAIREMNNVRNKINDLNMKHDQMMKDTGEENSDRAVMESYYALINAPRYGLPTFNQPLHPSSINTGVNLQGGIVPASPIITATQGEIQPTQQQPLPSLQSLSPVQQRMILEKNSNIKTVVVYDQSTGNKWFDIIDVTTGNSIPDVARPAQFLLDDMIPDFRNGVATNVNANMSYPLVLQGSRAIDEL